MFEVLLVLLEASLGGVRQELCLFLSDRWAPTALATFVGARAPACGIFRDDVSGGRLGSGEACEGAALLNCFQFAVGVEERTRGAIWRF